MREQRNGLFWILFFFQEGVGVKTETSVGETVRISCVRVGIWKPDGETIEEGEGD